MDEKIKRVTMALAAMDGMTPEHFHAQDESFRIGYYRRARAAIEAYAAAFGSRRESKLRAGQKIDK